MGRLDAELAEAVDLVLHQRDQGRDDDREPIAEECRHPVADRLAGPRRGDREHIPACQLGFHHLDLAGAERLQAEHVVEHLLRGHGDSVAVEPGGVRTLW